MTDTRDALEWLLSLHAAPGENAVVHFERCAERFRRETGYLAPGKDCRLYSHEERRKLWDQWIADGLARCRAALSSLEADSTDTADSAGAAR